MDSVVEAFRQWFDADVPAWRGELEKIATFTGSGELGYSEARAGANFGREVKPTDVFVASDGGGAALCVIRCGEGEAVNWSEAAPDFTARIGFVALGLNARDAPGGRTQGRAAIQIDVSNAIEPLEGVIEEYGERVEYLEQGEIDDYTEEQIEGYLGAIEAREEELDRLRQQGEVLDLVRLRVSGGAVLRFFWGDDANSNAVALICAIA